MKRRCQSSDGTAILEFAIVLPLLLLFMMGIFDFGFLFQNYLVLTNAAREGARMAVLQGYGPEDVALRVTTYAHDGGVPLSVPLSVTRKWVSIPVAGGPRMTGYRVRVEMPYTFPLLKPVAALFGWSWATVTLRAQATMRTEVGVSE